MYNQRLIYSAGQGTAVFGLMAGGDVITFAAAQAEPTVQAGAPSIAWVALAAVHTLAALRAVRSVAAQPTGCVQGQRERKIEHDFHTIQHIKSRPPCHVYLQDHCIPKTHICSSLLFRGEKLMVIICASL